MVVAVVGNLTVVVNVVVVVVVVIDVKLEA